MPTHDAENEYSFTSLTNEYLFYLQYERANPVAKSTLVTHTKRIHILQRYLGHIDLRALTKKDVNLVRVDMAKRGLKAKYISVVLSIIRAFLRYCREEKGLNVLDPREIKLPSDEKGTVKFLLPHELKRFINAIDKESYYGIRFMAFVTTLLDTGMRLNEALSLKRSVITNDATTSVILGKGSKERLIFFRGWSLYWIRKYLSMRKDTHENVFVSRTHGNDVVPLVDEAIRKYFRFYGKKSGVPNALPHTMRRTGATYLRSNGADVHDIQKWLGHTKIAITEKYLGVNWDAVKASLSKYQSYGDIEMLDKNVKKISWSKDGRYDRCLSCSGRTRPHLAKGHCDTCYVRLWRKRKSFTLTSKDKFGKINRYEQNEAEKGTPEETGTSVLHGTASIL